MENIRKIHVVVAIGVHHLLQRDVPDLCVSVLDLTLFVHKQRKKKKEIRKHAGIENAIWCMYVNKFLQFVTP